MDVSAAAADYFKFCPGEEHVKISNAICRGRRRASFPKCPGCQFNDDERGVAVRPADEEGRAPATLESIFKLHDMCATTPTPLSGDAAWRIGHAAALYLHGRLRGYERASPGSRSIVVGRDLRASSEALQFALMEGAGSVGMDVINIGVVDTPQVYFAVSHFNACGGIQITGGAMPAHYNGFKLCGARGCPIGDQTGLAGIRDIALRVPKHHTGTSARVREADVGEKYGVFVRWAISGEILRRRTRIVVDAGHGVAGRWVPAVFGPIANLAIDAINFDAAEPFAHQSDPFSVKRLNELRKRVKATKAHLGVCFSGDADQCVFVDDKGAVVGCDLMGAVLARIFVERQRGAAIVLDVRSSLAASEEIERAGGVVLRERVGHHYMRRRMSDAEAVFGVDLAGRFYFRENQFCESAFLALAHVLNLLSTSGCRLSELLQPLQRYRSSGEVHFTCEAPDQTLQRITEEHQAAQIDPGPADGGVTVRYPDWWFHVRRDDLSPSLHLSIEARTKKLVEQRLAELKPLIARAEA